jgi:hypothetical protein
MMSTYNVLILKIEVHSFSNVSAATWTQFRTLIDNYIYLNL